MNLRPPAVMARLALVWLAIGLGFASGLPGAETAGAEAAKRWARFEPEFKAFAAADRVVPPSEAPEFQVGQVRTVRWLRDGTTVNVELE